LSQTYLIERERLQETIANATPSEYAQHLFSHLVESVASEEVSTRRRLEDQTTYFLTLVDLTRSLPPSVKTCIEAWVQLYLGLFWLFRSHREEADIALDRVEQLLSEYDLPRVELTYLLYTTFDLPILHPSFEDFTGAWVRTTVRFIELLPKSRDWLAEYNARCTKALRRRLKTSPDDASVQHVEALLEDWREAIPEAERVFSHICAMLLLLVDAGGLWSDDSRRLQEQILPRPLDRLDPDDLFDLYDDYGKYAREQARCRIMDGNADKAQELSASLHNLMSLAIERYGAELSSEQLEALQEHLGTAELWSL
jgi:hypothetical protein